MLIDYKDKQSLFYNFICKSVANNKVSHAYLIETNGVSYAYDLALSMAKFFLCDGLSNEQIKVLSKNIDNGNYPDIKIIDSENIIKKDQLLQLQKEFANKPLYGKYMIYIIKDANKLNNSSSNTILKFLEEPQEGIIAILLTSNIFNVLDTISSRCQIISLIPEKADLIKTISEKIETEESESFLNNMFSFYEGISIKKEKLLLESYIYSFKDNIKLFLTFGLYYYVDLLNLKIGREAVYHSSYIDRLNNMLTYFDVSDIIRKINIVNKFIENCRYNVNKDLFIDNFIISLVGGNIYG